MSQSTATLLLSLLGCCTLVTAEGLMHCLGFDSILNCVFSLEYGHCFSDLRPQEILIQKWPNVFWEILHKALQLIIVSHEQTLVKEHKQLCLKKIKLK